MVWDITLKEKQIGKNEKKKKTTACALKKYHEKHVYRYLVAKPIIPATHRRCGVPPEKLEAEVFVQYTPSSGATSRPAEFCTPLFVLPPPPPPPPPRQSKARSHAHEAATTGKRFAR